MHTVKIILNYWGSLKLNLPIKKIGFISFILLFVWFAGCKKPGIGGDASITGYVHVEKWNATFTQFIGEYAGKDQYVYIVYGDHPGYDKRIKTDYNGEFEFPYLYEGHYKIYIYSKDSTFADPSGITSVVKDVNITSRKEVFNIDTLLIFQ